MQTASHQRRKQHRDDLAKSAALSGRASKPLVCPLLDRLDNPRPWQR